MKQRHDTTNIRSSHQEVVKQLSTLNELEASEPKFQSSFWLQLKLLTVRQSRQHRGQRLTRVATLLTCCWTAFTCLAWGRLPDTTTYIFNKSSLLSSSSLLRVMPL